MPDIFGKIEIPSFHPDYDSGKKYGSSNANYKKNLKELLNRTSNDVFKRAGEDERKLEKKDIRIFEHNLKCKANKCRKECVKYKNLKKKYILQEKAHIILQPGGVKGFDTGLDLRVQYNVQKAQFEPSEYQGEYSETEKLYIVDHINKFHLNDEAYKTNALMTFFEDVIETSGHIVHTPANNLVVDLFKNKLEGLEKEEIVRICNKLYIYYTAKLKECSD